MSKAVFYKSVVGFFVWIVFMATVFSGGNAGAEKLMSDSAVLGCPDALIELPRGEHAVIVEKGSQRLSVFNGRREGGYEIVMSAPCSTGEVPGVKKKDGDKKTPEGIYFCLDEYEDRYLSPVYGKKAFPTDYPNVVDRRAGRDGSAIWLHGTNKRLRAMNSNGCVAMNNDDILKLSDYIHLFGTPVIMVDTLARAPRREVEREKECLLDFMNRWSGAVEKGSYHDYLAFYDSSYLPPMAWWRKWVELRKAAWDSGESLEVLIDKLGIYKDKDIFVLVFEMGLTLSEQKTPMTRRQIYIQKQADGYSIIGERFPFARTAKKTGVKPGEDILVAFAGKMVQDLDSRLSIRGMIDAWLAAWTNKDMDAYGRFYAWDFHADGLDREKWIARKKRLSRKYRFIKVTGEAFSIDRGEDRAVVTFLQNYRSSGFSARGEKRLVLVKREGVWKIYRESWKKS